MKRRPGRFRLRLKKGQARLLRLLGYPFFGFVVFMVSLYLSLPLERIKDRLERELSQEPGPPIPGSGALGIGLGMDVSIGQLGLHVLPLGASLSEITLRPRRPPSLEPEATKPKPMFIEDVTVYLPILSFIGGGQGLDLAVQAIGGTVEASGSMGSDGLALRLDLAHLGLGRAPILAQLLPLPIVGNLGGQLDLKVPSRKPLPSTGREPPPPRARSAGLPPPEFSKATGLVEIKLEQAVLGDGKAKLVVPGDPFLSQGLTFPRLTIGNLNGRVVIDRGRASLSDVHSRSADAEVWLEGYVDLRDPLPQSELKLYLRFLPSAALIKREPTIEILNNAMAAGKRSDGAIGFAITGTFGLPRSRPAKEPPEGVSARPGSLGQVGKDSSPSLRPGSGVSPPTFAPPAAVVSPPIPPSPSSQSQNFIPAVMPPPPGQTQQPSPPSPTPAPAPAATPPPPSPTAVIVPPPPSPSAAGSHAGQGPQPGAGEGQAGGHAGGAMGSGMQAPPPAEGGGDRTASDSPAEPANPPQNLPSNQRGF